MQVDPARTKWPVRTAASFDRGAQLHFRHPELGRAGPDGKAGERLGRDIGIEPVEHLEPNASPTPEDGRQGRRFLGRFDRDPAERPALACRARRRSKVGYGLADPLEGDLFVWQPGPGGGRPLAA